ncbi:AsnC-type helix-turn-helix domain-containing protein [Rhizobium tibeticum]|uniref:AsnC-type helix-turn-helix domain-containing protein n=1 Tax=Rhizobium tibeticum TaxID=501024 RepID=A0A1H8U5E7_9HYPH|nr:AsnC family transcriptional regulator [Rhizobium tibeticum]SEI16384.1 leucine-responsive transcriptional regulator [Rhizobium tibeticum]SEO98500.1 AsnC-type helix-turn-helix domain-containing protein [Rhizobium tibeticum]
MLGLPKLDHIDINILGQLQQNSRLSNVDLAQAVGFLRGPVLRE